MNGAKESAGLLVLRGTIGLTLAAHGLQKFLEFGMAGLSGFLGSIGVPMPGLMAPVVATTELAGGLLVATGLGTRWAALPLAFTMIVAALTAHRGAFFAPRGMEYVVVLAAGFVAVALLGPGKYSVDALLACRTGVPAFEGALRRAA